MTTTDGVKHWDELVSVPYAPGYRDVSMKIRLHTGQVIEINLKPDAALQLYREIIGAQQVAWSNGRPIDAQDYERRPLDIPQRLGIAA